MTELEAVVHQVANDHIQKEIDISGNDTAQPTSTEKEGKGSPRVEDAKKSPKDTEKDVPVSAHQREQKGQYSSRVKEAKRYNNRDRSSYGNNDRKFNSPRKYENHSKFDPASMNETDDPIAIRKQVCQQTDKRVRTAC